MQIDWISWILNVSEGLAIALITSVIAFIFTKKYLKKISFANKMKQYGFSSSVTTNDISAREYKNMFEKADRIRIMYVSGNGFFKNREHLKQITQALQQGTKIQFLLARKNNPFLKDIVNLEVEAGYRKAGSTIDTETENVHKILAELQQGAGGENLNIRYFSSEYRLPMTIAEFRDKDKEYALSWLNITLPPYKSNQKFLLRGREEFDFDDEQNGNLVLMMIKHFDAVWDQSCEWDNTAPVYWQNQYQKAKNCAVAEKDSTKILIQASAQHPLKEGRYPDTEFINRLNLAISLYNKAKAEKKQVKIYVPGSLHIPDSISLSAAGKEFLQQNQIPQEDIYGEDMNLRYKNEEGVYNSADECYVSSQIYKNEGFDRLYCICSPLQSVKNTLFFIENGILPQICAVPADSQYHNPYFEAAEILPEILYFDHSWQQPDSFYAKKTREKRKPKQ